ncbi:hypothetical protein Ndes2526B_g04135 [Nannochloris sp. 'desiccata']
MAFSVGNTFCQNQIRIGQRVSGNSAFRATAMRQMQPKRAISTTTAYMETETSETATPASTLQLTVSLKLSVAYGEHIRLVGNSSEFGSWELEGAPELTWTEGDIWTATLDLPAGFSSEYKFVHYIPGQQPIWEFTENRFLTIPKSTASKPISLDLTWCEPFTVGEEQNTFITTAAATFEARNNAEYSVQEGLVTPSFQSAVDSVQVFLGGAANEQEHDEMAEQASDDVAALEAAFEADSALKQQQEEKTAEEGQEVTLVADLAKPATEGNSMLENAAKTAGALALGVAGAALFSALAIDIADTAIIGAVAAAAGGAVLSGSGSASSTKASRKTAAATEDGGEEVETEEFVPQERKITGAGETGVILAAGLLSAFDAGRSMVDSMTTARTNSTIGSGVDEEESAKMDQE